ncbi:MAG TPA: hypothetical protein PK802_07485 [Candidatus Cloacimonadota bacterium]|jgi:hypothetical protein|nr:hypothetical protein [Candidatus Cloacimonadota bacterium]HPB09514.1 hypothetical protein [Candidatus Cloacimonadota bacterium]HPL23014.1 hypothetical protein [Candidatus Cloacimonadota bacterium]HQO44764.1 hypothetical protein [Candidatus Cloacimonadota bacterium]HQP17637.1 hypothetical protein [Candidatus Cloacimonadota bacterium]
MIGFGLTLKFQEGTDFCPGNALTVKGGGISSTARSGSGGSGAAASDPRHAAARHKNASTKTKLLLIFPAPFFIYPLKSTFV